LGRTEKCGLAAGNRVAPTEIAILFLRFQTLADSIISRQALRETELPQNGLPAADHHDIVILSFAASFGADGSI